jgi:hypothetical protein
VAESESVVVQEFVNGHAHGCAAAPQSDQIVGTHPESRIFRASRKLSRR